MKDQGAPPPGPPAKAKPLQSHDSDELAGPGRRFSSFGALTPLLAPRSVAVVGASDRAGNVGGVAVRLLQKYGYEGPVWPVNAGRPTVGGLACVPALRDLPSLPDLAIVAVPAEGVISVVHDCVALGVPAAIVWAGGFAETGEEGRARQRQLEDACRGSAIKLCGPNCIGVVNTAIGLVASFGSQFSDIERLTPGAVSMVSQSGGTSANVLAQAQRLGLGFRVTASCGNEAALRLPAFIRALCEDEGTRVIAVYVEGLSDPEGLVEALAEARRRGKPVVILKGGATEASGRAALAHTGRLAGMDRTYDAIFREFAVIRVHSPDELLDVCLQLVSWRPGQLPSGNRVVLSTFGGGSGVVGTDLCARAGLVVPALDDTTRRQLAPLLPPIASSINPIDLTPVAMNNPEYRTRLPEALRMLADAPGIDMYLFFASGLGPLAPLLVEILEELRARTRTPILISWLLAPPGIAERLAASGVIAFSEHARSVRTAGYLARYGCDLRHRIRHCPTERRDFAWDAFVPAARPQIVSEHVVARMLEAAGLPVAKGRLAATAGEAVAAAEEVGFPVAVKGISAAVTHRAAAGLVALNVDSGEAVVKVEHAFRARAAALGAALDGVWVQHMFDGTAELLVTAFRDREFGVMVGCGLGGNLTEVIDDVVFARAPIDTEGALDLLDRLRTLQRLPDYLSDRQRREVAGFVARFASLVAGAPWERFTFEVNPVKVGREALAAVDGLLVIE